jgi:hypothetical protein
MNSSDTLRPKLERLQGQAFAAGLVGLILWAAFGRSAAISNGLAGWQQFYRSYLFAYVYWVAIPLGCTGILMLHHLTHGKWGFAIRRIVEAGSRTLAWMAVLFIPIVVGMPKLYAWARPEDVAADSILQEKRWYLNPSGFNTRAVAYFAILLVVVYLLNKYSRAQDQTADRALTHRMAVVSGPGMILWGLIVTGAAVDWVMSLEPHWHSTIYGMLFMVIEGLAAMSVSVFVLRRLSGYEPFKDSIDSKQFHDLGNLMLALVMLWAYLSFDQLLIVWAGNLKDEIPWYMQRAFGAWAPVGVVLIVLHFAVPFLLLLQRTVKRRLNVLSKVAALLVVLSLVDVYWIVVPAYQGNTPRPHWLDLFALIGIGGIWLGAFLMELKRFPLLPLHDPQFEGVLEHSHGD